MSTTWRETEKMEGEWHYEASFWASRESDIPLMGDQDICIRSEGIVRQDMTDVEMIESLHTWVAKVLSSHPMLNLVHFAVVRPGYTHYCAGMIDRMRAITLEEFIQTTR
jgi:hypothetical protein